MVRWETKDHTYKADWETVTSAFWGKYPNDKQPHVKIVDTLHREIDTENAVLRLRRLVHLNYDFPLWYRALSLPVPLGKAVEDATVSLREKTLKVKAENITLCNFVNVAEEYEYSVHPDNPQWTKYSITHSVTLSGVGFLTSRLESKFIDNVRGKFRDGLDVMTERISNLQKQDWRQRRSEWQDELANMALLRKIRENLLPECTPQCQ